MAVEFGMFAAGVYIYLACTRARDRTGTIAFWALVAVVVAGYLAATFGPPPPSSQAVAWSSLMGYLLVAWGWWVDRHRESARATP
jgi:RsiW-degrading membrane proteinase PrsW (M82 family)